MNSLTLPTGRVVPLEYLTFDEASQHAFYGGLDVTAYLTRAQLQFVGGLAFDVERANREASDAARDAAGRARVPDALETNTGTLWLQGVGGDVAKLATDTRDFFGLGVENTGKGSPLLRWALLAGAAFALHQLGVFTWVKKKLTT